MIAMAKLGDGPCRSSDIAASLGEAPLSLGPRRAQIISKGMIYSRYMVKRLHVVQRLRISRNLPTLSATWEIEAHVAIHSVNAFVVPRKAITAKMVKAFPETQRGRLSTTSLSAMITGASR